MSFPNIIGHGHLLDLMARAAVRGSLPPSLIFAGPEGVGKRMAAIGLAQLVNCLSPVGADTESPGPCGECSSCKRIARGVHADVLVVEPEESGTIKIDQVREAIERTAYRPFEGRRRMVIIDDAHELVVQAQDALLKTLEEPPATSSFVLVTSLPGVLVTTIRSRCQILRFGRLAPADVASALMRTHGFTESDAHAAAALSDGSIGAAIDGSTDEAADARAAASRMLELAAAARESRGRLASAEALVGKSDRHELTRRLHAVSSILRDLGVLLSRADERNLANADLKPLLVGLQRSFDSERALRAFSAVDRALSALDRNASPKIVADWLAFQI
jgi:DNA polymerase III subunit delta'